MCCAVLSLLTVFCIHVSPFHLPFLHPSFHSNLAVNYEKDIRGLCEIWPQELDCGMWFMLAGTGSGTREIVL